MIRLSKVQEPEILSANGVAWRDELMAVYDAGAEPTKAQKNRYNHVDVKQLLIEETCGKCAYCESLIRHIDDGDIEHIIPKGPKPEFSFTWPNLTLACTICNRNKSDYISTVGPDGELINPYVDEPSDHFLFHKEILSPMPESLRAHKTEEVIKLNRNELIEMRRSKVEELHGLITAYVHADEAYKDLTLTQIRKKCLGNNKEYSGFLRSYITEMINRGTLPAELQN